MMRRGKAGWPGGRVEIVQHGDDFSALVNGLTNFFHGSWTIALCVNEALGTGVGVRAARRAFGMEGRVAQGAWAAGRRQGMDEERRRPLWQGLG